MQTAAEAAAIKAAQERNEQIRKATPKVIDPDTGHDLTQFSGLDPLGYGNDYIYSHPRVAATTNDIWVALSEKLIRFDRQTGSRKESGIKGKIQSINVWRRRDSGRGGRVWWSCNPQSHHPARWRHPKRRNRRGPGAAGSSQGDQQNRGCPDGCKTAGPGWRGRRRFEDRGARNPRHVVDAPDADIDWEALAGYGHEFIAAGPNVVQFQTKMLEHKMITHEAMKPKPAKSIMESGTLTAGQSMEATQEMLNDLQREKTGGVTQEDVSRYQVTLRRHFASGAPDWTGEVSGPPQFFAFKTVDVVAAGNSLQVFSKDNQKLWDAKLTFTVPSGHGFDGCRSCPAWKPRTRCILRTRGF